MHYIEIKIRSSDLIYIGDWCCYYLDLWELIGDRKDRETDYILRRISVKSRHWKNRRWLFKGLPEKSISYVTIAIKDASDAMAFKLRWL